jgi:ubiquinol-cytochrome c reductase cytochrome c subunit
MSARGRLAAGLAGCTLAAVAAVMTAGALTAGAASGTPSALASPAPAGSALPAPSGAGAALFAANCSHCHGARGEGLIGPSLAPDGAVSLVAGMVTRGGIKMPAFNEALSPAQIDAVAAYVAGTLSDPAARLATAAQGGQLYRLYCSGCHSAVGRGGALTRGIKNAPNLSDFPPAEAIAAMDFGPDNMPVFAGTTFTVPQQTAVALYVEVIGRPPSPGGRGLGYYGPVTEGVASVFLLVALLVVAVWLAHRKEDAHG